MDMRREGCGVANRRLGRLSAHLGSATTDSTAMSQTLAVAMPWLLAGGLTSLWAAWPAFMAGVRALNPRGELRGTALTKEMLEAFAQGLKNMAISHPSGAHTHLRARCPTQVSTVLSPKHVPVLAIPALARPNAMARRLALSKMLNPRLAERSTAASYLPYDLIEKIGLEGMTAGGRINQLGLSKPAEMAADLDNWISDAAGTIAGEDFVEINEIINGLHQRHGIEAAVVTLESCEATSAATSTRAFSTELFNHWGIGGAADNNGVLVVHSLRQRKVDIVVGDGMRSVLPDALCDKILSSVVVPHFRRAKFSAGLKAGIAAIAEHIAQQDQQQHPVLHSWQPPAQPMGDFGGGKKTPSSFSLQKRPGGILPPVLLALGAYYRSGQTAEHRCEACGDFAVVTGEAVPHSPESEWVDDVELELATHMDSEGKVSRQLATKILKRYIPKLPIDMSRNGGHGARIAVGESRLPQISSRDLVEVFKLALEEPSDGKADRRSTGVLTMPSMSTLEYR